MHKQQRRVYYHVRYYSSSLTRYLARIVDGVCYHFLLLTKRRSGTMDIIFAIGSAMRAPLGGLLADGIGWRWYIAVIDFCLFRANILHSVHRAFLPQVPSTIFTIISISIALKLPKSDGSHLYTKLKRMGFVGTAALVLCILALLIGLD